MQATEVAVAGYVGTASNCLERPIWLGKFMLKHQHCSFGVLEEFQ